MVKTIDLDLNDPINKIKMLMIERANENRRRAKKKAEPKKPKVKKEIVGPVVKGKRGRKPKSLTISVDQIIDSPYQTMTNSTTLETEIEKEIEVPITEVKIKKERKKYERKIKPIQEVQTQVVC